MSIFSINDNSNYNSILSQAKANKESKENSKISFANAFLKQNASKLNEIQSANSQRTQKSLSEIEANTNLLVQSINDMAESIKEQTAGITQINDSVAQIDQTTKDNVEIANESAIISSTVSDIANNILEDVKKKRF
ncbi:hypothetical protein QY02_00420 [Campylobacter jejuni]|nr:hypothetical protein QY02_00420 [Campylobacter jejuni]